MNLGEIGELSLEGQTFQKQTQVSFVTTLMDKFKVELM